IRAFKQEPSMFSTHTPRILEKTEDDGSKKADMEKKNAQKVVKILEEERKTKHLTTTPVNETPDEFPRLSEKTSEIISREKLSLEHSEVLLVKGTKFAVGLSYAPGMVPVVTVQGKKKEALDLINKAFKLNIPVIEVVDLEPESFRKTKVGDEISEKAYSSAAKALALIYRMKPDAHLVRFVKPQKYIRSKSKSRALKMADKYKDVLDVVLLSIEVSEHHYQFAEDLKRQLEMVSRKLVSETGLLIPDVKIVRNRELAATEYLLKIKDVTYYVGALDDEIKPPDVFYPVQSRFRSLIFNSGYELLGYSETQALVERVKEKNPGLIKSLFPSQFTVGALRFILRCLLREQIPIKDMTTILETIEVNIQKTSDPELLTEYIRASFSRYISNKYQDSEGCLNVLLLSGITEQVIMDSVKETLNVRWLDLDHAEGVRFLTTLGNELKKIETLGIPVIILTSPSIRRFIKKITETTFPELQVISYSEVSPLTPVKTVGVIDLK
ncbi:MAG: FHIPEP family type III secretion protein, partial [Vulcanimicrobiota bacterium]